MLPDPLHSVIAAELPSCAVAAEGRIAAVLRARVFDAALAASLAGWARSHNEPRELRLLACVLLELQLRVADPGHAAMLVAALSDPSQDPKEDPKEFLRVWQRKLDRFAPLHASVRGFDTSCHALRALIRRIDCETTVLLARWFFTPEEVVEEILRRVRVSSGISAMQDIEHDWTGPEIAETLRRLPAYEREIIRRITAGDRVLWVGEQTPSMPNALVAQPDGMVALVVKAPGSDLELEIKRTGVRGPRPLQIRLHADDGSLLPSHHHFWGGSMGGYLRCEAHAAASMAWIYRMVHGEEPPVSRVVTRTKIVTVPVPEGEQPLVEYFNDAALHGADLLRMQRELPLVNERMASQRDQSQVPNDPTALFVLAASPHQSLIAGTSAFRLDRLHAALHENPAGVEPSLLEQLLEEILEPYVPVRVSDTASPAEAVEAAFAANREAARSAHLAAVTALAKLWGTLAGCGAGSQGESFVPRNVGLRKVWRGGAWQVAVISMDHDSVQGFSREDFNARSVVRSTRLDRAHLLGGFLQVRGFVPGTLSVLDAIYRIDPELAASRRTRFMEIAAEAFHATRIVIREDPRAREMFPPRFVERMLLWESYARELLNGKPLDEWEHDLRTRLHDRPGIAGAFIEAGRQFHEQLPELALFYRG